MLTAADVATQLGISAASVRDLCRAGLLTHHRVGARGGAIRIRPEDVEAYLERTRVESATARPRMTLRHVKL